MNLDFLHSGVPVPEYSTEIPWLTTCDELSKFVPLHHFQTPTTDGFPILKFTLCGVTTEFGLHFAERSEGKLIEVVYSNPDPDSASATFEAMSASLLATLGNPDYSYASDDSIQKHLRWLDCQVVIDCAVKKLCPCDMDEWSFYHDLTICYSHALPNHWNNHHGDTFVGGDNPWSA